MGIDQALGSLFFGELGFCCQAGKVDDDQQLFAAGEAVGRLARHVFHAHAKDFHIKPGNSFNPGEGWFLSRGGNYLRGAIIGHGDVPLLQALRSLKRSGYNGVLSIEFEGMENLVDGIAISLENLRRFEAAC